MYQRILAATDLSKFGNQAVAHAARLALLTRARLLIAHVIEYDRFESHYFIEWHANPLADEKRRADAVARARADLARLVPPRFPRKRAGLIAEVHPTAPAGLLAIAERERADLLVLASHGLGGFRHLILGSTPEKVLREVSCPILLLKEPRS